MAKQEASTQVVRPDGSAVAEAIPGFARLDNDTLRELRTVDDVQAYLDSQGVDVVDAIETLGTGWIRPEGQEANENIKRSLVESPCTLLMWIISPGDYFRNGERSNFVTLFVITDKGERYIVTDGSTGLSVELEDFTRRTGRTRGLRLRRGLRKSDYKLDAKALSEGRAEVVSRDFEGATADATTFYLNV